MRDQQGSAEAAEPLLNGLNAQKLSLHGLFWDGFCTVPTLKIITKRLEASNLSGKVEV